MLELQTFKGYHVTQYLQWFCFFLFYCFCLFVFMNIWSTFVTSYKFFCKFPSFADWWPSANMLVLFNIQKRVHLPPAFAKPKSFSCVSNDISAGILASNDVSACPKVPERCAARHHLRPTCSLSFCISSKLFLTDTTNNLLLRDILKS